LKKNEQKKTKEKFVYRLVTVPALPVLESAGRSSKVEHLYIWNSNAPQVSAFIKKA
jgi:hypothetical protein